MVRLAVQYGYRRSCSNEGMGMKNLLVRIWKEEDGQDLTEYALLLALVALGAIAAMQSLGTAINSAFGNATNTLSSAVTTS
jgi:pilus assembly protein Flp/PilA